MIKILGKLSENRLQATANDEQIEVIAFNCLNDKKTRG